MDVMFGRVAYETVVLLDDLPVDIDDRDGIL